MSLNPLFYCKNKDTYPPFKNGLYLEEYFLKYIVDNNIFTKRKYIPILWTNCQIESWFKHKRDELQKSLNEWLELNDSDDGFFTVVQYDDGPLLDLPKNTIIFGACSGNIPIPLVYEDKNRTLVSYPKKDFNNKEIFCSFVGNITGSCTSNVRTVMFNKLKHFNLINSGGWKPSVDKNLQNMFIETTLNSKFALAPRGYGRSSFRFFECFQLGTIPIYIYDDINWLPFQDVIDYNKLCIVIHVSELNKLENKLREIDRNKYYTMLEYYETIKYLFTLEGMTKEILNKVK